MTRPAREVISRTKNRQVAERAGLVVDIVEARIKMLAGSGRDLGGMPALVAYPDEDGSLTLEWKGPGLSVGFNIENEPDESGWHVVYSRARSSDEEAAAGFLSLANLRRRVESLLDTVVDNS